MYNINVKNTDGVGAQALALSAYARVEDRTRALAAGFQMHLAKPVNLTELTTAVASLTGRTGLNSVVADGQF